MARRNLTVQLDDDRYEEARKRAERSLATARPRGGRRWERDELYAR